ncbi:MAG: hypothetical protein AVDCRST_MAG54-2629, partial [uncultured Actinomycetospora sp.]
CTSPTAGSRSSRTGGARRRSAWPGWPTASAPSSTPTPSTRAPPTASRRSSRATTRTSS